MSACPPLPPLTTRAEAMVWDLDGPDGADRKFRHAFFRNLPDRLAIPIAKDYRIRYETQGRQKANRPLLDFKEMKKQCPVTLDADDRDIRQLAKLKANRCFEIVTRCTSLGTGYAAASTLAKAWGVKPPKIGGAITLSGAIKRLEDPAWWRRKLRRTLGNKLEQLASRAGLVHRRAGIYASDESVVRRGQVKQRNRQLLEELTAINDIGDEYSLADLVDRSVSNPRIRRSELMTRIAGFDQYAQKNAHVGELYTITCPSRMHARLGGTGTENLKYDGTTPREAQNHLTSQWAKARAALHRANITIYGFRIAEPHHDGTPHWHLLLFMPPEDVSTVRMVLRHYALEHDGDEPGADRRRFTAVSIDWSRGSAAGYIAKYVSKNVDGHGLDADSYGRNAQDSAVRVEAWASLWGIRQFQQIGGPPVTPWRELRRLSEPPPGILGDAFQAADDGDWARYIEVMGGASAGRADWPLRLAVAWSDRLNRYEEPEGYRVFGVEGPEQVAVSRPYRWTIGLIEKSDSNVEGAGMGPEPPRECTEEPGELDNPMVSRSSGGGAGTVPAPMYDWSRIDSGAGPGNSRNRSGTFPLLSAYRYDIVAGDITEQRAKELASRDNRFFPLEFCQ
ncbi:MAG: replication endonuclease [Anaerolineales bacterium]